MTVGFLLHSAFDDPSVAHVLAILASRGVPSTMLDAAGFPGDATVTHELGGASSVGVAGAATFAGVDLHTLQSIWVRPSSTATVDGPDALAALDDDARAIARGQSGAALDGLIECFDGLVVDRIAPGGAATRVGTLTRARRLGFDIPPTIITSDATAVRRFAESIDGEIVVRFVDPNRVVSTTDPHGPSRTRLLEPGEIDDLDGLELAPMQFQQRIPKALELRATVVGARVFTAAVDSSGSEAGALDWRTDPNLVKAFERHTLADDLDSRLLALCDALGLNFATADLILTPDNHHVLLEVNSASYYDFVETATDLPISQAVADLLDGTVPPRWPSR